MAEYIEREEALAIIEEKQKELCPVGRYGRSYVYGSDREKYDAWEEIIDALENIPSADVAPVVHGCFEPCFDENGNWRQGFAKCSNCGKEYYAQVINHFGFCPNCGAKMDGGVSDEAD
nr:MAG TPA: DNA-directed RNA polymerase [Caudoviricetes sp.]